MLAFLVFVHRNHVLATDASTTAGASEDMLAFAEGMAKVQGEIEKKYENLRKNSEDEDEYIKTTTKEQAKFVFRFLDRDGNGQLDRNELIRLAKLTISNDTESAETYADVTLHADQNADKLLSFDEFYQPKVVYGGTSDHRRDEKHQHKDGHGYDRDPKHHEELWTL